MNITEADPKGLIRESYAMDGISLGECRSIFVDWALSLPAGTDIPAAASLLMAHYATPGHPMTATLREGLAPPPTPMRRGGRAGRIGA